MSGLWGFKKNGTFKVNYCWDCNCSPWVPADGRPCVYEESMPAGVIDLIKASDNKTLLKVFNRIKPQTVEKFRKDCLASGITHYEGRIAGGAVLDFRIDPTIYLNENVHIMLDYAKYMYGDGYFPETDIHVAYIINLDEKCLEFRRAFGNEEDGSYLIIRKYPFNVIRKQRKNDILKDMIAILDAFEDVAGKRQDAAPDDEECVLTRQDVAELETTVPFTLTA